MWARFDLGMTARLRACIASWKRAEAPLRPPTWEALRTTPARLSLRLHRSVMDPATCSAASWPAKAVRAARAWPRRRPRRHRKISHPSNSLRRRIRCPSRRRRCRPRDPSRRLNRLIKATSPVPP